ncbi:uncharacterized protein LOC114156893 isoform X4 [Xiphophorus couchianus]|uniref:uncharacterized protein LOC114156893 isoform X4 n=1 Tax=Xiphophorus couchianus TaxID=32473 RepID=UPI00101669E0|nr:uncharacterized protein LOC114156893 isoform X4 [Xiphophorus couchianus]
MSSVPPQREFINEQVTPAGETFTEFKEINVKMEEEMEDQRRLMDFTRIPRIILHRIEWKEINVKMEEEMEDQRRLMDFTRIPRIILHRIEWKEINVKMEEEMEDQRRLMDFTRIPRIILHRIGASRRAEQVRARRSNNRIETIQACQPERNLSRSFVYSN